MQSHGIGSPLRSQGGLARAEQYYREALDGCRRVLGNDHVRSRRSINNMAALVRAHGRLAETEPLCRQALAIAERLRKRMIGEERSRAAFAGELGLSGIAARLSSLLIETDRPAEAWSVAERGPSRAVLDLLARDDRNVVQQARICAEQTGDAKAFEAIETALDKELQAKVNLTTAEALLAGMQSVDRVELRAGEKRRAHSY